MLIREYQPADLEIILSKMGGSNPQRRSDKLKSVEIIDSHTCLVAEEDSQIHGFIVADDLGKSKSYYISDIKVIEKRKGIGSQLVKETFNRIGPGGHICLCVDTDNEAAIKFYESLGFTWSGYTKEYRKGEDKHWYRKDI